MLSGKRFVLTTFFSALLIYAAIATRQPLPGNARIKLRIQTPGGTPTGLRLRVTNTAGDYFAPLGHLPTPDYTRRNANDLILGDGDTTPLEVHALVYDGAEIDLPPGTTISTPRKVTNIRPSMH